MVRTWNSGDALITEADWDTMVAEQVQNSWTTQETTGASLTGSDGTSGRTLTLSNTPTEIMGVYISGQRIKSSQYSLVGAVLTINIIVDDTSDVVVDYLK